ncbi:hypothetical protein PsYK624_099730 [Phanerochaete sordida]|uniref:Uncharacterized protein n=1 Tax=Phanerochaete sordida TaxID=48140 RepID=A0A9P3GFH0_9APHY|nr:hypothetical protein PsYK624_099730 [Phanerochaete sordida]
MTCAFSSLCHPSNRTTYSRKCSPTSHNLVPADQNTTVAWAGRLPTLLGDVLVLALTWAKTAAQVRATRRLRLRSPLYALFLRDGTLYFVALAALNASQLVLDRVLCLSQVIFTCVLCPSFPIFGPGSDADKYMSRLTAVLVSRFLLNLRRADDQHAPAAAISSLRFAGGIESLVRPLAGGGEEGEERYECVDDAMHGDVRASGSIEEIGLKIEEVRPLFVALWAVRGLS